MIDVHSHILPGIDDGARSIEETCKMLRESYVAGFRTVISTSHYLEGKYISNWLWAKIFKITRYG